MRSRALAAAVCLVLICAGRVWAQAPDTVLLEELTWTEVRDLIGAKTTTIIVPVGGTEQNGPHMTLGKHNARVKILANMKKTGEYEALVKMHLLGRLGEPDDVAYAAVYLASDEAKWITGLPLSVDGGIAAIR